MTELAKSGSLTPCLERRCRYSADDPKCALYSVYHKRRPSSSSFSENQVKPVASVLQSCYDTYNLKSAAAHWAPGSGKNGVLDGLTSRIVTKDVLERVLSIDLSAIVVGSGICGQFEEIFKALFRDIENEVRLSLRFCVYSSS